MASPTSETVTVVEAMQPTVGSVHGRHLTSLIHSFNGTQDKNMCTPLTLPR